MIDRNASPRELALGILIDCAREKSYIDLAVKKALATTALDRRDKAFAARVCYGVVQHRLLLDHYIGEVSSVRLKKIHPIVLDCLRIGFYQLLLMEKVPPSAAVNTTVELVKKSGNGHASGFANALMRAATKREFVPPEGMSVEALSIKYSHPEWLTQLFVDRLGAEQAERLLAADNEVAPTCARLNSIRCGMPALKQALTDEQVTFEDHPFLPDCLLISDSGDLERLPSFAGGLFTVQDAASQLCVLAAGEPGGFVIDACAAPGGKSFYLAEKMGNRGTLISCDIHAHKIELILAGARRLGVDNLTAAVWDAREFNPLWQDKADLVLADLPCSGLGIIRKKPDIRYKNPEEIKNLPALQKKLLENLARYVKPGGKLVYSTCTLTLDENEGVVRSFLKHHGDFSPLDFSLPGQKNSQDGMLTLWPHTDQTDGFFICCMKKSTT